MAHKQMDPVNLYRDLGCVLFGTEAHHFLYNLVVPSPRLKVLEAGCGSAKLSIGYAIQCRQSREEDVAPCWHIDACDTDQNAVLYAFALWELVMDLTRSRDSLQDWFYVHHQDLHEMAASNYYDLVFNEGVPQHWPDEERRQGAINKMTQACRPGGTVCVIGNNGLLKLHQEEDAHVAFQYEGMPPTRKCFTPEELAKRLHQAGLEDVNTAPVTAKFEVPGGPVGGGFEHSVLIAGWGKKPD